MSTPDKSSADAATCQSVPNSIEWNELITPDPAAALKFYCGLFGWTSEVFEGVPGQPYTLLKLGDRSFGGVMAPPMPGIPPHWLHYVTVTSVDDAFAKATSLGASTCLPPTDIGEVGRIAVLKDPQGAIFGLHQHPKS
jgi:predicted enzyme related to lactoylglutathione lyase